MRFVIIALIKFLACVHAVAPIVGLESANVIPDSYIIVLKNNTSKTAFKAHIDWVGSLLSSTNFAQGLVFNINSFKGYTLKASKDIIDRLSESEEVEFIEADQTVTMAPSIPFKQPRLAPRTVQPNAPWGLARISHRKRGSTDYVFEENTGIDIYVLDTGVRITHQLFQGWASYGFNAIGGSDDDGNGHGTHVAGIASSQIYGVARFANIISVKVLDDSGSSSFSVVISGINWAVQDMKSKGSVHRATALLALGGAFSTSLNQAVAGASTSGLFVATVAGNSNSDASNFSPASEPTACTAGGTNANDEKMSTSNFGSVVDIFAPGQQIPSLWITNDTSINTLSGTSMAGAHIAGLGAYFLALEGPRSPGALCERLREVASKNTLSAIPSGTVNLMAYNLSGL